MLLAVEIDNSEINFGLFEENSEWVLVKSFKVATDLKKTSDEYVIVVDGILTYYGLDRFRIHAAIVSSVVPQMTDTVVAAVKRLADVEVMTVGKGIKTGFPIKIDNPTDLGADLVANAAAVIEMKNRTKKKMPHVIIDMGTATTIFAINANGEYIGGCIIPGVGISLDVLHGRTAQLPAVTPHAPTRVIGKNSRDSVRSGVILGNAIMIDGFIRKFSDEMHCDGCLETVITGEYAEAVMAACEHSMRYVPELTLKGLCCIYKNNSK